MIFLKACSGLQCISKITSVVTMYGVCHDWYHCYRDVNKKANDIDVKREDGVEGETERD